MNKFSSTTKPTSPYRNVKPNTSAPRSAGVKSSTPQGSIKFNRANTPGVRPISAKPKSVLPKVNFDRSSSAIKINQIREARKRRRTMLFSVSAFASIIAVGAAVAVPLTLEYMSSTQIENNSNNNNSNNSEDQVSSAEAREKLNKAYLLISNNIGINKAYVDSKGEVFPAGRVTPSTFGDYVTGFGVENGIHTETGVKVEVTAIDPSEDNTRLTATFVMSYGTETMTEDITIAGFLKSDKVFEKTWDKMISTVKMSDEARKLSLSQNADQFRVESIGKWLINWKDVNEWGVRLTIQSTEIIPNLNSVKITYKATIGKSSATNWMQYGGFMNK